MVDDTNKASVAEEQTAPQPKKRHRKRILIPLAMLVVVAAVAVFYWYSFLRGYVSTDDAYIDGDAVTISSKVLGRIVNLNAAEGDSVYAGELLVQLDDSDLRAEAVQAQADLDYVRKNVELAKIALDRARDDFARDSIQYQDHVITHEKFDHARQALEMAKAQIAVSQSQVTASQAKLAVIETKLTNTKIVSAARGVVARKWVVPGDIVQPGQPIYTIFDLNSVWITANFEETKLSSIHPGDSVEIHVDAVPDQKFMGSVELIGAAAASQFSLIPPNNASGNFTKVTQRVPVKITIANLAADNSVKDPALLPGMSVEVKVRSSEH
jgi:membrane fusion protein (multidrug efflux system)